MDADSTRLAESGFFYWQSFDTKREAEQWAGRLQEAYRVETEVVPSEYLGMYQVWANDGGIPTYDKLTEKSWFKRWRMK